MAWSFPVTWQRWRSHHSIRHSQKPMLHANFMALYFIESELLPMEVLHCGNRDFRPFLLLWPWPVIFVYELNPFFLEIYRLWAERCQIRLREDIGSSSMLTNFVLDFRYLAPFRNEGGIKASGVKNSCYISHFLPPPPVKIMGRVGDNMRYVWVIIKLHLRLHF